MPVLLVTCTTLRQSINAATLLQGDGESGVHFVFAGDTGEQAKFLRTCSCKLANVIYDRLVRKQNCKKRARKNHHSVWHRTRSNKLQRLQCLISLLNTWRQGLPILSSIEGEMRTVVETEGIGLQYQAGDHHDLAAKIRWFFNASK